MRMNISVPDSLAAEVRKYGLPVSQICQRALSAEAETRRPRESDFDLVVTVRIHDAGSAEEAVRVLAEYKGTFDLPGGRWAEITRVCTA